MLQRNVENIQSKCYTLDFLGHDTYDVTDINAHNTMIILFS